MTGLLSTRSAVVLLSLAALCSCGGEEVDEVEAENLAAQLEAGATNAIDETEAHVLREQANSLRERSEGNEAATENMQVAGH